MPSSLNVYTSERYRHKYIYGYVYTFFSLLLVGFYPGHELAAQFNFSMVWTALILYIIHKAQRVASLGIQKMSGKTKHRKILDERTSLTIPGDFFSYPWDFGRIWDTYLTFIYHFPASYMLKCVKNANNSFLSSCRSRF